MLGLPKATELNKQLPKKAIYTKFQMNTAVKEKIDSDISRIMIVNEVTPDKINVSNGEEIESFFVMHVALKKKNFNEKNIITLSKLIPQKMLFVLEFDRMIKVATFHTNLIQTNWENMDNYKIEIKGLNFDKVWENIILQIGDMTIKYGNTLDEQLVINEQKQQLRKKIEKIEKQARNEKQPRKKFQLASQVKVLKKQLGEIR